MNTAETVTAIAAPSALLLAGLFVLAAAKEWIHVSASVSLRAVPAAKRKPRNAVEVQVIPGTAEDPAPAPSISAARRTA